MEKEREKERQLERAKADGSGGGGKNNQFENDKHVSRGKRDRRRDVLDLFSWFTLDFISSNAGGESAERASEEEGVEMLYGAFVFDKTCIKGGCAIAIPNLFYFYFVCLISYL